VPKKSPIRINAEKLCQKFPAAPSRTLAKRIAKECKINLENARSMIRQIRGNAGKSHRSASSDKSLFRPNGKAGTKPKLPPSLSKKWEPFKLDGVSNVAILCDLHLPYHDERAILEAVSYCKKRRVDCVVLNGDYCDFYAISRFERDPKKRNLKREVRIQREGLKWLRSQFPKARIVYKFGNHCERWTSYLWNSCPEISDFPQTRLPNILGFKKLGIEAVDNKRPIMAGKLPIFHGHELSHGISSPVNVARGVFLQTVSTALVGHHHRTSSHTESNWNKEHEIVTWSVGCLCELHPHYRVVNKVNQGFAICEVESDGQFEVDNYRLSRDYKIRKG